jgi:hypothetical protein
LTQDNAADDDRALNNRRLEGRLQPHPSPMRSSRYLLLACLFVAPAFSIIAAEPVLKLVSPGKTVELTAAAFAALPHQETKSMDMGQQERSYSGVPVRDLLARLGAPSGEKMRGPALLLAVIVHCKDNYNVLFSLAEFDESFTTRTILLADKENGEMLPPSAAPFRLITPGDKHGARGARQVLSLELVSFAKP